MNESVREFLHILRVDFARHATPAGFVVQLVKGQRVVLRKAIKNFPCVTLYPMRAKSPAAVRLAGPPPITATFLPVGAMQAGAGTWPAPSTAARLRPRILMGASISSRRQRFSLSVRFFLS